MQLFVVLLFLLSLLSPVLSQAPRKNGGGASRLDPIEPGEDSFEKAEDRPCDPHFRSFDGRCTNSNHKLWGAAAMPHFSYFRRSSSVKPRGGDLPSARYISNVLCRQSGDMPNKRGLSELVTFFGQFLDHNIVATPVDPSAHMNIPIPDDDPIFGNFSGELPFERSVRGQIEEHASDERPINSLSSAIDLAAIYGSDTTRIKSMRLYKEGKLQTSAGNMLQINTESLRNAPSNTREFFLSGDHRANEHPVLTSFHTLFMREHNRLCEELKKVFPHWSDEDLFKAARKINGALFQKVVYTEFIPAMTGRRLGPYLGFLPWVNPAVSDIFSTAAFRVGHTMVGNGINRRGRGMSGMARLRMQEMFFRPRDVMKEGISPFLRGAMYNRAQEVDLQIQDSLRNFLFTGIPQEKGFDLVALNLQRGRDHALGTYNDVRRRFGLRRARRFRHITKRGDVQAALATAYGSADRVEAWVGLVAEDHAPGASMGRTMLRVWAAEFTRLRDGDRFFYRRYGTFPPVIFRALPHLRGLLYGDETLRALILRNTDITEAEIGRTVWKAGRGKDGGKTEKERKTEKGRKEEAKRARKEAKKREKQREKREKRKGRFRSRLL